MTTVVSNRSPVLDKLDEMCENGWRFNSFPQGKVVRVSIETDLFRVFNLGLQSGVQYSVFGQARISEMPHKVKDALGLLDANPNSVWTVYYFLDHGEGQWSKGSRNIIAVFPHSYKKESFVTVVEIGCEHDYTARTVGRCAYRFTCNKCGFEKFVDSSD